MATMNLSEIMANDQQRANARAVGDTVAKHSNSTKMAVNAKLHTKDVRQANFRIDCRLDDKINALNVANKSALYNHLIARGLESILAETDKGSTYSAHFDTGDQASIAAISIDKLNA